MMEAAEVEAPRPSVEDVLACSFDAWHPQFRHCSLRAAALQLSSDFLAYLSSSGTLVLPSSTGCGLAERRDSGSEEEDFELRLGPEVEEEEKDEAGPRFPELDAEIERCVAEFEGAVFPKLNWSAPLDAAWINFCKSLKCTTPADVYLLLKSSERIVHDLLAAFSVCPDEEARPEQLQFHLVLKKWYDMRPEREIRCFVRSRRLIAASQRHLGGKTAAFLTEHREQILDSLLAFFAREIRDKFPRQDYVFDAYWTASGSWKLIDFNPFGMPTDTRLFTWAELLAPGLTHNGLTRPELRVADSEPGRIVPHEPEAYGVPIDVIDLATGSDPQKFMDLLRESVRRQKEEASSSEDED